MMDDAERAYDGGYEKKAVGGMMEDEDPENLGMSQTQEKLRSLNGCQQMATNSLYLGKSSPFTRQS